MEKLDGYAVIVVQHSYAAPPELPAAHMSQRVSEILGNGDGHAYLFKIVPEKAPPEPYKKHEKARSYVLDRSFEVFGVDRLSKGRGHSEYVVPFWPEHRREDQRGVVQPEPFYQLIIFIILIAQKRKETIMYLALKEREC